MCSVRTVSGLVVTVIGVLLARAPAGSWSVTLPPAAVTVPPVFPTIPPGFTCTEAVPLTEPAVAEIVVVPAPTAVTSPAAETVATVALALLQVMLVVVSSTPADVSALAVSCTVPPGRRGALLAAVTVTVATDGGKGGCGVG